MPHNGDAYCKRVTATLINADSLRREEAAYSESLRIKAQAEATKKIELF